MRQQDFFDILYIYVIAITSLFLKSQNQNQPTAYNFFGADSEFLKGDIQCTSSGGGNGPSNGAHQNKF